MAVQMSKLNSSRDTAIVYSGDVVEVSDDKIRVLVSNEYPKIYVDIKKEVILDIFVNHIIEDYVFKTKVDSIIEEYIQTDPVFKSKVDSTVEEYMRSHPIVLPDTTI